MEVMANILSSRNPSHNGIEDVGEGDLHVAGNLVPRVSGAKADCIIAKLGFQYSHRVEAIGFSGGIWLGWKGSIRMEVVRSHPQFILTKVWHMSSTRPFFISFVYANPNRQK
ncbi:reverse transcriptase [Gossypium australe]|uniref:Reverse transcriptase n=1 Tax=Gossypium australe TaxID=47621 RepID=A0A5B6VL60_9ROSI|nr:reverse transcriptase [Gossypium australe]